MNPVLTKLINDNIPLHVEFVQQLYGFDPTGMEPDEIIEKANAVQTARKIPPPLPCRPPEDTRDVDFCVEVEECYHRSYDVTEVYRDTMSVPVQYLEDGEDAVRDYIYENYNNYNSEIVSEDLIDDEPYETHSTDIIENNISDVISDYEDENEDDEE